MYKKFLPALFIIGSYSSFAQTPVLTSANNGPSLNDTFITVQCNTTGIVPGATGAGITWDFSTLSASTYLSPNQYTASVMAATSSAPGYSSLAGAATTFSSTTFATSTYATVTSSGFATFYHEDGSILSETGVYINSTNSLLYTTPLVQLEYPFTYLNTFNGTYSGYLVYTPSGSSPSLVSQNGYDTVIADGYGTLKIPGYPTPGTTTTYTGVLRVHSTTSYRDSANLLGTPVIGSYLLNSYTWYVPGYHAPLLTISSISGPGVDSSIVAYAAKQTANHEAVPIVQDLNSSVNIYPNPTSNYFYVNYYNAANQKVKTSILDVTGREVSVIADETTQGNTVLNYNASALPKGVYMINIQSPGETVSRKLVIQ